MALIGIGAYVAGYIWKYPDNDIIWADLLIKLGDVLIIGVVVGYLTSVAQWSGIFKREIQDIVFGKEFLNKRNDIEDIWYNVTKQMFKFKFSDIHKDMLSALRQTLPKEGRRDVVACAVRILLGNEREPSRGYTGKTCSMSDII